jgi:hypothetical protein
VNLGNDIKVRKVSIWVWYQYPVGRVDITELIKNPGVDCFVVVVQFHLGFEHLVS